MRILSIGVWGTGSDDVGLIQSTKTQKRLDLIERNAQIAHFEVHTATKRGPVEKCSVASVLESVGGRCRPNSSVRRCVRAADMG